ncbi:MAG: DUF177 domain-containing protein [Burkholderiaceae bacterium]|jgi:uncharacterized protein|nr:DUF177 domain-containing protein [Burkholderiaceae bacterium]
MSSHISEPFDARHLDIARFAAVQGALASAAALTDFPRLADDVAAQTIAADAPVMIDWQAQGLMRRDIGLGDGIARVALHLSARARLPLVCQRCLQPVWTEVAVDRHFLFAQDETQAAQLDEHAQDDVLVLSRRFDLHGLIEDELLLALPLAPRHDHCPGAQPLPARDAGLDAAATDKRHPFVALAALRERRQPSEDGPDDL